MLETVVKRILVTPGAAAAVDDSSSSASMKTPTALANQLLSSPKSSSSRTPSTIQCVKPHSTSPMVCYVVVMHGADSRQLVVIQNTSTQEILWQKSTQDIMAAETDSASSKSARNIDRIQDVDFCYHQSNNHLLSILFQNSKRLLLYNTSTDTIFKQFTASSSNSYYPTTTALFLSSSLLTFGCSDGSFRVYDLQQSRVLKSARAGKQNDVPLVQLLNVTTYYNSNTSSPSSSIRNCRILVVNSNNVGIVWELVVDNNTLVEIKSPLARLEQPGGGEQQQQMVDIYYDGHRDYVFYYNKQVSLWDLSLLEATSVTTNTTRKTPKPEPYVIGMTDIDATTTNATFMVPGWLHPSFSKNDLLCAVVTQHGDFAVYGVSLQDAVLGRVMKAAPLMVSTKIATGVQSIRILNPTTLMVVTTTTTSSILLVTLQEQQMTMPSSSARHVHFGNNYLDYSKSVLMVQDSSSIAWGQLQIPHKNPHGVVYIKNPTVVHSQARQQPSALLTTEQSVIVKPTPVMILSPSHNYVCLFWSNEERYEILHVPSLLRRHNEHTTTTASVSTGTGISSFAWVGDDDVFAVLHPGGIAAARTDSFRTNTTAASSFTKDSSSPMFSGGGGATSKKKAFRKSFDFVRKGGGSSATASAMMSPSMSSTPTTAGQREGGDSDVPRVELRTLIGVAADAAEISGSISAATEITLGDMTLRGGNRSPPAALFGGPVLCVACSDGAKDRGVAYFYTKKSGADESTRASAYMSSGPAIPSPDLVEWDDDGRLCAVIVESRISVFLSDPPHFTLLGNVQLGSPTEPDVRVTGAKFVHGVLYCTTEASVQCIFLGSMDGGICHLDSFLLASSAGPQKQAVGLSPPSISVALCHPVVLGYQSGSLLLSTTSGVQAISLNHPLLRIGSLLAAGHPERARRWFDMIPSRDHESLALFLERRGEPALATDLPGLSIERTVDLCLRYNFADRLERLIEEYGVQSIRGVDQGRPADHNGHSLIVCVGAYLLSQGKSELVRRLATECLQYGKEGKKEAFVLAGLLLAVDPVDARRLVMRAIGGAKGTDDDGSHASAGETAVMVLVRDHLLK